jgi:hypothetical protein
MGCPACSTEGHSYSFRASADYLFSRHNILGGSSVTQNNVRASVGIVYSFGGSKDTSSGVHQDTSRRFGMLIPVLGVRAVAGNDLGALIVDEAPDGAAALAGLHRTPPFEQVCWSDAYLQAITDSCPGET